MKLNLEATLSELSEHTEESLTHRIMGAVPSIVREAFLSQMNKSASTPAEPHERIKGSDRNPEGSARSEASAESIKLSDAVISALEDDVKEHNEKANEAWQRVSLATLKAVWRRGAGAFSVSHRPNQNRQSWAFARVNAFRKIVMGGGNSKYVQDDDLLHADHPRRRTKKAHDPECCGDQLRKARGGEMDLVAELAGKMRDMYTDRLEGLSDKLGDIAKQIEED